MPCCPRFSKSRLHTAPERFRFAFITPGILPLESLRPLEIVVANYRRILNPFPRGEN